MFLEMEAPLTMSNEAGSVSNWSNASSESSEDYYLYWDLTVCAPYHTSVVLWKVWCPIILVFGTFGNSMTLIILRTMPSGGAAVTVFFSALAVSDLLLLYTGLLRRLILSFWTVDLRELHDVICKAHMLLVYLSAMTSSWFLVAMTMQRVASVLWPHRVALLCTQRKALVIVVLIVIILVAFNFPLLVTYTLHVEDGFTIATCTSVGSAGLLHFDLYVHPWIDLVFASLLPALLLFLGNSMLVVTLVRSVRQASRLTSQAEVTSRKEATSSLTVTLVSVSMAYLLLTLPVCVFAIVLPYVVIRDACHDAWVELGWVICNLVWYCNSAINFYLYCLTGTKFRTQCRRLLCGARRGTRAALASTSAGTVTSKTGDQERCVPPHNVQAEQYGNDF